MSEWMSAGHAPPQAIKVVVGWLEAIEAGDFARMWRLEDDNLRLCEAQLWVHANRDAPDLSALDPEELAVELAGIRSGHRLRREFELERVLSNKELLPPWPSDRWGFMSGRRYLGSDLDAVLVIDTDDAAGDVVAGPTLVPGELYRSYVVCHVGNSWRVAGHTYSVPIPGWPPVGGERLREVPVD